MSRSRFRGTLGLAAVATAALALAAAAPALAKPADPPGNNGTVKIDGIAFDQHPDNEPHVGCEFQVDFYGFDEGDLFATVTFAVHPPSGNAVILEDQVFIGEDSNAGGGSIEGLDAESSYSLDGLLSDYVAHPIQGYHIKLTVNADGSQGADTKHKVFWVTGCDDPDPSPDPSPQDQ